VEGTFISWYEEEVQLGTPEIPEYVPGFLYCVDGIAEKYMQAFLI
jgi:hypothetical protein